MRNTLAGKRFSKEYKERLFILWYQKGRPWTTVLYSAIPPDEDGQKPSLASLKKWISDEWTERGDALDEEVRNAISKRMVAEKVKMLERHVKLAREMQEKGSAYIEKHLDEITSSSAVRMLVEGVRIERESRGVGTAIKAMIEKTDEELLKDIQEIIDKPDVIKIEQIED